MSSGFDSDAMTEDPLVVQARSRLGRVLREKYRLDRVLGVGGMAAVYAGTHTRNAGRVAIKILHREASLDRDLRARFLREGYAANVIEHPGAIRVLDDDTAEDGSAFLVMELLDGETVDARWERSGRRLGIGEVVSIALDLLDVLAAAHAKGIVHRDVKPENLFVTRDGRLKVLDFGVARVREASPTRTKSGAVFGTPAFMAPEQALGRQREIDALTDVWAVGATMFSLVTARFVHEAETPEELVVRAATTPAPSLAAVLPSVPAAIAEVIDRALRFERAERWPSAGAMRDALVRARDQALLSLAEDFDDEAKTRLGPPPQMTLPPNVAREATVPLPTLAGTSSVGGVTSNSDRRLRWAFSPLVALVRRAQEWVRRHGAGNAARRAWATIAALALTNALRHRRRLVLAVASGLATSVAIGTILLFALRGGSRHAAPAAAAAPSIAGATASTSPWAPKPTASSSSETAQAETPATLPETPAPVVPRPLASASAIATPTRPPVAPPMGRPPPTPKPARLRRDPLAP